MKKVLSIILILACLSLSLVLFACENETTDDGLNIIDDKYRNWYEIFVHSYYDTDGNGIGDINGVTQKLDYIKDMGYNGIWLMPINVGTSYHKYDVEDYYNVDSNFGSVADVENLVNKAHEKGIRIIMDLVVNHTSSEHPWFKQAKEYILANGSIGGEYGEYYNFTQQYDTGFSKIEGSDYYYEARFWSGMPDLNLDSEKVREEIASIMRFWLNKGIDGFRLDAVTSFYTYDTEKNIEFLSWLNTTAKSIKSDCYLIGEAWLGNDSMIAEYYQSGIDSFFTFTTSQSTGSIAAVLRDLREDGGKAYTSMQLKLQQTYGNGIIAPFLGNHDTGRPGTFLIGEDKVKMAGGLLSMLNGSTFVYYGEEIGMISKDAIDSDPHKRIAMYWDKGNYNGWCYTTPENIIIDESYYKYPTVKGQQDDPNSILNYYKKAMRLRNTYPMIARGTVEEMQGEFSDYVSVIKKTYNGESIIIVINVNRESSENVTINVDNGNNYKLSDSLCVNYNDVVTYNETTGELIIPPYSIVILK